MDSAAISKDDYHIGIITALPIERAAITAMLDVEYDKPDDFSQSFHDSNSYTWGRIGVHPIVIASLAAGVYGNTMATATALPMLYSFPNIKFGLMVGIGAGIPTTAHDVRLGDVVVSQPSGISGGVFQYDLGKARDNKWERKDFLARPPEVLLKALNRLQTDHEFRVPKAYKHLHSAAAKHEYWSQSYRRPDTTNDRLFPSLYKHDQNSTDDSCSACDLTKVIQRAQRPSLTEFKIHYGVIGSGNSLVKDAELRDWIASMDKQCICLEMEAAGLMNNFPCLVIRGICDYADTHKNDMWQRYACATAAALSKELLAYVPLMESKIATKATEVLQIPDPRHSTPPLPSQSITEQMEHSQPLSELSPNTIVKSELPIRTKDDQSGIFSDISSNAGKPTNPPSELQATEISDFHRDLLLKGGKVNARLGENNDTLLHLAIREKNVTTAAWLIENGADIDAGNQTLDTPLHVAAQEGHLEMARLLIKHGANIEAQTEYGATPLHIAAKKGHQDIAKLLIEHKAKFEATYNDCTPLFIAAENGHLGIVELLIIDCKANIEAAKKDGSTPLYVAAQNGHSHIVKHLVEHGANVGIECDSITPLRMATERNYPDVVKVLAPHETDINATLKDGVTLLYIAAKKGHLDVINILIENKADVDVRTTSGAAPLWTAADEGHLEVVRSLIRHQVNVEVIYEHCTPLYIAAENGHAEIVKLLAENKANPDAKCRGAAPLEVAVENDHLEAVKQLVEHQANIEITDWTGTTPLFTAMDKQRVEIVKFLLDNGANIYATVLMVPLWKMAQSSGNKEIVELFEAHKVKEKPRESASRIRGLFGRKKKE